MALVEGLLFLEIHGLRRLRFPSCWRIISRGSHDWDRITRQLTALAELLDDPEPAGPRAVGSVTVLAGHARLVKAIRGVLRVGVAEKELPCGRFTEKIRQSGGGIPTHPFNLSSG